jgi:hypothetical protein
MPESYDSIQGYTPEQQQQMARWEVEDGRLSLEEANEMLKNNGIEANLQTQRSSESNRCSY